MLCVWCTVLQLKQEEDMLAGAVPGEPARLELLFAKQQQGQRGSPAGRGVRDAGGHGGSVSGVQAAGRKEPQDDGLHEVEEYGPFMPMLPEVPRDRTHSRSASRRQSSEGLQPSGAMAPSFTDTDDETMYLVRAALRQKESEARQRLEEALSNPNTSNATRQLEQLRSFKFYSGSRDDGGPAVRAPRTYRRSSTYGIIAANGGGRDMRHASFNDKGAAPAATGPAVPAEAPDDSRHRSHGAGSSKKSVAFGSTTTPHLPPIRSQSLSNLELAARRAATQAAPPVVNNSKSGGGATAVKASPAWHKPVAVPPPATSSASVWR